VEFSLGAQALGAAIVPIWHGLRFNDASLAFSAREGRKLDDAANKVRVKGHQGPHPEEYHREVFRRLNSVTLRCRSMQQCRESLVRELQKLAKEIVMEGSELNKLVTRTQ
jgi:hypothetical protein